MSIDFKGEQILNVDTFQMWIHFKWEQISYVNKFQIWKK
jgi:hypothetical protein